MPIGFAVLIAVALGRRWAWVEEDRETASRLKTTKGGDIHVGFANDLKDEALLGYASLFILVPLALHQIQGWTNAFVVVDEWSSDNAFVDWLRFFGAELAKAVPFVDWWEIYNVDIETPFDAAASENPLAKHLTFAARAMVDLVIMAALFQAIALWQRARTQSRYYDSGQFDSFDPFTEKIFFENGMIKDVRSGKRRPKKKFEERVNAHVVRRRKLGFSPTPYDARRLSELMNSPVADVREGANWMIAKYKVLAGTPAEQLRQLVDQFNSDKFRLALERDDEKGQFYIRDRKAELERVLLELERRPGAFRREQVKDLIKILIIVRDLPEFTPAEVTAVRLFRSQLSRVSRLALYNLVLEDEHRVSATGKDLQTEIATEFGADSELYAGLAPMRVDVFAAIEFHGLQERDDKEKQSIARFLRWMSATSSGEFCVRGDRAKLSRDRAATAARRVELSRRWPLKNKIS
ncbi:MAG: hypothetical protein VX593_06745 [Pseudomonadota bacterium]|nr:hypothetical protein [Pseudomonadota bacterium]